MFHCLFRDLGSSNTTYQDNISTTRSYAENIQFDDVRLATECDIAVELKHPRRDAISSQKKERQYIS